MRIIILLLPLFISGCTAAFEIGESLNQASSNIAHEFSNLWGTADPASAVETTDNSEPNVMPREEIK
jgi:hypothetical protein